MMDHFFEGFGFRTNRPDFDVGDEIEVYVTGMNGTTPVARIGDTVLRVPDAPSDAVDKRVRLRVEEFDDNDHEGEAAFLDVVGAGTF